MYRLWYRKYIYGLVLPTGAQYILFYSIMLKALTTSLKQRATPKGQAQSEIDSTDSAGTPSRPSVIPLSTSLTDRIPTEIHERFIAHADKAELVACSLVCRTWLPSSRVHLRALLIVFPVNVLESHLLGGKRISAAVPLGALNRPHSCTS